MRQLIENVSTNEDIQGIYGALLTEKGFIRDNIKRKLADRREEANNIEKSSKQPFKKQKVKCST
jgi:hypothetical protein